MKSAFVCCGIFLSALSMLTAAQTVPDAGSLQQQIEQQRPVAVPGVHTPDARPAPAPMTPTTGPLVTVRQFRFVGNTMLSCSAPQLQSF
jgi:hypothetical protein